VRTADNLTTFMCRLSNCTGSLNLHETYGHVQACTEIAFNRLHQTFNSIIQCCIQRPLTLALCQLLIKCAAVHIDFSKRNRKIRCVAHIASLVHLYGKPLKIIYFPLQFFFQIVCQFLSHSSKDNDR